MTLRPLFWVALLELVHIISGCAVEKIWTGHSSGVVGAISGLVLPSKNISILYAPPKVNFKSSTDQSSGDGVRDFGHAIKDLIVVRSNNSPILPIGGFIGICFISNAALSENHIQRRRFAAIKRIYRYADGLSDSKRACYGYFLHSKPCSLVNQESLAHLPPLKCSYASINYYRYQCEPPYKPRALIVGGIAFLIGLVVSKKVWWWMDSYFTRDGSIAIPLTLLAFSILAMFIGVFVIGMWIDSLGQCLPLSPSHYSPFSGASVVL